MLLMAVRALTYGETSCRFLTLMNPLWTLTMAEIFLFLGFWQQKNNNFTKKTPYSFTLAVVSFGYSLT